MARYPSGWRERFVEPSGRTFGWGKNYYKKGYGSVKELGSKGFYWSIELEYNSEDSYAFFDGGYASSLLEAMMIVDDTFELIDRYE